MRIIAICATLFLFASQTAFAKESIFSDWRFEQGRLPSGKPFCAIMSAVRNRNIGKNLIIKVLPQQNRVAIDLYFDKWARPQGSTVQVMFDFLDNRPLSLEAYADGHILDINLPPEYLGVFLLQVVQRPALQAIFPDEDEDTWTIANAGAAQAVDQLTKCAARWGWH